MEIQEEKVSKGFMKSIFLEIKSEKPKFIESPCSFLTVAETNDRRNSGLDDDLDEKIDKFLSFNCFPMNDYQ